MKHRLPYVLGALPAMIPPVMIYVVKPLLGLAQEGAIIFEAIPEYQATREKIEQCDVLVLCRNCEPIYRSILENARELKKPIIYDLDDNFWEIPADTVDGRYLGSPERLGMLEDYLKVAALVRVYNPIIFNKVSSFNSNVVQLKPCIDLDLSPQKAVPKNNLCTSIVYPTTRGADDPMLNIILGDIDRVLTKYPDRAEAVFWGYSPESLRGHKNIKVLPIIKNYEEFIRSLAEGNYDIGLAPLLLNTFSLSKTDTKFRDYGACRIAGIYSNAEVYSNSVCHEETGLLVDNKPDAWFTAMERLILDENLRLKIQNAANLFIKEYYSQEKMEDAWMKQLTGLIPWMEWPDEQIKFHEKAEVKEWTFTEPPQVGLHRYIELFEIQKAKYDTQQAKYEENLNKVKMNYETNLAQQKSEYEQLEARAKWISQELDTFRRRKIYFLIDRFFNRANIEATIPQAYQRVRDDSVIYNDKLDGYRVRPSPNLGIVSTIEYEITLLQPKLNGAIIAPILEIPLTKGEIGVRIISPQNVILVEKSIPMAQVEISKPLEIHFESNFQTEPGRLRLQIFANGLDATVRIYEWQKYPLFGFGPLKRKAFCGFCFAE